MFKCGINGCKKSKLRKHTHTFGELRGEVDMKILEDYRVYCQMRGEPFSVPGGMPTDMNQYMSKRLKDGAKEAKNFRKGLKK